MKKVLALEESNWKQNDVGENEDDYFHDSRRRYNELIDIFLRNTILSITRNGKEIFSKVLEIGPLFGHVAITLKKMGYNVYVSDIQSQICKRKEKYMHYGILSFECDLNYSPLPFTDNMFDYVIFSEVLEHIQPFSAQRSLCEIYRVLKPNGRVFFSTPNMLDIGNRLLLVIGRTYLDPNHVREYYLQEIYTMFRKAAFKVDAIRYSMCYAYSLKHRRKYANIVKPFLLPIRILYPPFRTNIFVIGEKRI